MTERLPNPGIEPRSPALQADSLPTEVKRRLLTSIGITSKTAVYNMSSLKVY